MKSSHLGRSNIDAHLRSTMRRSACATCQHEATDAVDDPTNAQVPSPEESNPLRNATIAGSLLVFLRRSQKRLWSVAQDDLAARLVGLNPSQFSTVTAAWANFWRVRFEQLRPDLRRSVAPTFDRLAVSTTRQVDRQIAKIGKPPPNERHPSASFGQSDPISKTVRTAAAVAVGSILVQLGRQIDTATAVVDRASLEGDRLRAEHVLSAVATLALPNRATVAGQAIDLVGSIAAKIQQERFLEAGVRQAIWRTQRDNRVRPTHRAREGKRFDVQRGLEGEFPGGPPRCRCFAEPVP